MQKPDAVIHLTETLCLCEFKKGGSKGFWLWDDTRGVNLSMGAESEREAFVTALKYYQIRLSETEKRLQKLGKSVNNFINEIGEED